MMQLVEFIFSNPIFIIMIFAAISLLTGKKKSEEQKQTPKKVERKPIHEKVPELKRQETIQHVEPEEQLTIGELRQKQLERLSTGIQGGMDHEAEKINEKQQVKQVTDPQTKTHKTLKKRQLKKGLEGRLTQKGLVESVIMSEVLGPPRSMKRYQSGQMGRRF